MENAQGLRKADYKELSFITMGSEQGIYFVADGKQYDN
jgi:hypothetical protein